MSPQVCPQLPCMVVSIGPAVGHVVGKLSSDGAGMYMWVGGRVSVSDDGWEAAAELLMVVWP